MKHDTDKLSKEKQTILDSPYASWVIIGMAVVFLAYIIVVIFAVFFMTARQTVPVDIQPLSEDYDAPIAPEVDTDAIID